MVVVPPLDAKQENAVGPVSILLLPHTQQLQIKTIRKEIVSCGHLLVIVSWIIQGYGELHCDFIVLGVRNIIVGRRYGNTLAFLKET